MPENPMKAGMTTKQKATIGALVVVVLIIVWQVMGLFGGGSKTAEPATNTVITPAAQPTAGANPSPSLNPATPGQPGAPVAPHPVMPVQNNVVQAGIAPLSLEGEIADIQKKTEQKYIDQINQLQMLRIQREIAETNQAIANARLATVTAERGVTDLLTKPSANSQQIPAGAYANALANPTPTGIALPTEVTTTTTAPVATPPPAPPVMEAQYVVISVSMQLGRWNAVLGNQGKLYNVHVGDVLPLDNSVVASISKSGVVLQKEGKRRKISILSAI